MRLSLVLVLAGVVAACSGTPVTVPTSPALIVSTTACAPSGTLSSASFTETGGQAILSIRTATPGCPWHATLPEWISAASATSGVGGADIVLTISRTEADRTGTIVVGESVIEVRQQTRIRLHAVCFSGRPGEFVPLACTAWIEYRMSPVGPVGRPTADFTAMGKGSEVFAPAVTGNHDWDLNVPANQPVGKFTIPIRLQYGDGFVAVVRPEFEVLPARSSLLMR
jgi:hypothetical protein